MICCLMFNSLHRQDVDPSFTSSLGVADNQYVDIGDYDQRKADRLWSNAIHRLFCSVSVEAVPRQSHACFRKCTGR